MRCLVSTTLLWIACAACAAPVEFVERHDNGEHKVEGQLFRSKQQGIWTHRWPNGNKKAEGRYEADVQVGPWTWWYENGQKRTEGTFHNEHSVGRWRYWHPNGKLHMDGFFAAGKKTGRWSVHDRNGGLLEVGEYEDGKRTSRWEFRRLSGSVYGWFFRDQMVGRWRYDSAGGEPSEVQHVPPEGVEMIFETWGDGDSRRVGFVVDGVATGRWVTWHDGESVRVSGDFADGTLTGTCRAYDPKGQLLAYGPVTEARPTGAWQLRQGEAFIEQQIAVTGRPPSVWSGVWSKPDEFDSNHAMLEVERWLRELGSPRNPEHYFAPPPPDPGPPPSKKLVAEVKQRRESPVPESFLTRRELRDLTRWVGAYTKELVIDVFASYESQPKRKDKSASRRLEGVVIDTTFETPAGKRLNLRAGGKHRATLLVMLRGFAGQVCPYCPMQLRALAPFREQFEQLGVRVVAVYPGPRRGLKGFIAAYEDTFGADEQPPYEIVYDVDSQLPRALGLLDTSVGSSVLARPSTFILDAKGRIQYAYVGRHRADRPAAESLVKKIRELRR